MEEFKANSSVHVAFREAMSMRLLDLERALGFPEMVPVPWHDYQIEANREATANHPNLKQAVVDIGGVWGRSSASANPESQGEAGGGIRPRSCACRS